MKRTAIAGELFPDADAIRASLERRTRDALLRRLGPHVSPPAGIDPDSNRTTSEQTTDVASPGAALPSVPALHDAPSRTAVVPHRGGSSPAERSTARGIGFGVELVRAILAGRKTQTRRPVRPQPAAIPTPAECPIARPGELLYVREPWLRVEGEAGPRVLYAADESHAGRRFRPAMYMPRAAARLWLRVTGVRAERLQAIGPADLLAEGLPAGRSLAGVWDGFYTGPGERYADDPWVWVVTFGVE